MQTQQERLSLLHQSGVISISVCQNMNSFLDFLKTQSIQRDDERLDMMSTHMVMALPSYAKALALWNAQSSILSALPEGEKYYILANFCNVIKE